MKRPGDPIQGVRLRSARARKKALALMAETFTDRDMTMLLLLAGSADRKRWVAIPGGMSSRDMAHALMVAADAVQRLAEHERQVGRADAPVKLDITEQDGGKQPALGRRREPECRIAEDGTLQPPNGESFVHCAECGCQRWFATDAPDGHGTARLVCVGCGNEIAMLRLTHEAGMA